MKSLLFFTGSELLASGFLSIFSSVGEFSPRAFHGEFQELLDSMEDETPDILLLDFSPSEGFSNLTALRERRLRCQVVLWVDFISMEAAFQAMKLGVRGILRRTDPIERVIDSLRDIAAGTLAFDKGLTTRFLEARTVELTARESQLPPLVAQGLKNKEIAATLNIAEATVRIYLSALYRKLGVRDRYELTIYALRNMPGVSEDLERPEESSRAANGHVPRQLSSMIMGGDHPAPKPAQSSGLPGRKTLRAAR